MQKHHPFMNQTVCRVVTNALKPKLDQTPNTVHTDDQPTSNHNETCPKCNRRVLSRGVLCAKGLHWIHYACEKLKKVDIDKLENPASDKHYICSHCLDTDNSLMTHSPTSKEVSKQKTTDQSSISLPKQPNYKRTMPIALNSVYTPDKHVKGNPIHVHVSPMEKQTITSAKALLDEELSLRTHSVEGLKTQKVPVLPPQSMSRNQKLNGTSSEMGTIDKELRQRESKLKRLEEQKKKKASISDTLKDQSRLKTYSVNMEAKVKELENSNRILRMKIVGTQNQPSDSPTKTRNSLPQNSNNETKLSIESHISSLENNLLKDRIAHIVQLQCESCKFLYSNMDEFYAILVSVQIMEISPFEVDETHIKALIAPTPIDLGDGGKVGLFVQDKLVTISGSLVKKLQEDLQVDGITIEGVDFAEKLVLTPEGDPEQVFLPRRVTLIVKNGQIVNAASK
ncbi:unnamed protein product [Mytilus edulis]|uniref:Uncharacterized protein n=1 Tax=Mytilus edulis TaxID=6550 RepID=A0A8S3PW99_MYTED|nr:unnamed protein product [Mytilus edulis]